ncbi:hypothetical protein BDW02DRAFT_266626 [Decorospora gaudefroyi]|uniref:Uncharacterized protein n=1 Tax=Decorospora gaudefroyi TaxID=184978 RepID=A0A6A5KFI3_9PLEO|nr:hypothetical protein BDW02DRAFT_266626 [Decorospora gaudefroyi]
MRREIGGGGGGEGGGEKPQRRLFAYHRKVKYRSQVPHHPLYTQACGIWTSQIQEAWSVGCSDSEPHYGVAGRKMLDDSESRPAVNPCCRVIGRVGRRRTSGLRESETVRRAQLIQTKTLHIFLLTTHPILDNFHPFFAKSHECLGFAKGACYLYNRGAALIHSTFCGYAHPEHHGTNDCDTHVRIMSLVY